MPENVYELIGKADYSQGSAPQLVRNHPELISVWFLGERRIIKRSFYDHVMELAHGRRPCQ